MVSTALLLPLLLASSSAFSISSSSTDIGHTENQPARSGGNAQSIELRCDLEFNPGESWTRCSWSHSFQDIWAYDNREGYVMCSADDVDDHMGECEDKGNLKLNSGQDDPGVNPWTRYDTRRLILSIDENYCGLTIKSPHANDTGIWKCQVNDNSIGHSTTMWADVAVFVANQSVVEITKPDLQDDAMPGIEVDLNSGSNQVDAECRAQYGSPPPSVLWYIDESSNTLDQSFSSDRTLSDGTVVSTVNFNIDEQLLSRYGVSSENSYFSLSLGCLPDQQDYFTDTSDFAVNPAEVMVYGYSGSQSLPALSIILLASIMTSSFL